ncbi:MAG TPA: YbhB/YbcL family Raf kinase inhibitor-like protein [Acidimicrobiales bacterium]|nr:YbhB/YbcL family Raf kinase inhibitor-like protein [Acidimicrobiales bacterium]
MVHTVAVLRCRALLVVVPAVLLLAGACSDDGRELAPVRPGQTTTSEPPPTIGSTGPAFALTSGAFSDAGEIPARHTCDGEGVSPDLSWNGGPAGVELALVLRDRDANGYVHWMLTGIDPTITAFGEGGVPEGAVEQVNAEGAIGYLPPCPPVGFGRHIYDFTLHVLAAPLRIDPEAPAADVAAMIEAASIGRAQLSGTVDPDTPDAGSR